MKWSRRKDRYIGRLYSDIEKVPSDSAIFWSTGELREFAEEYMGLIRPCGNRGERPKGRRPAPPLWSELDKGGSPLFLLPLLLFPSPTRKGGVLLLLFPSPTRKGGVLGSRTPPLVRLLHRPATFPLAPIYMGAGGTPKTQ